MTAGTPPTPLRICIAGASGRMGQMLIEAIRATPGCQLTGALDIAQSPAIGSDAAAASGGGSGVAITADLQQGLANADVLIDFTRPEGTLAHLAACRALGVKAVIGTTGFDDAQKASIAEAAQHIAIMMAPNMSVGVNVTLKLLEMAARALSTGYDIEIIEAHHRHKVDAPSGTALKMGEVIAQALGRNLKEHGVFAREGITGERDPSSIGFSAIRGGDIVGDHTVLFAGTGERIEISHKSSSRATYAQGALRAARFLATRQNGLFDMFDVLGLGADNLGSATRRPACLSGAGMNLFGLFASGDAVSKTVTLLLLCMSIASWVVILWKSWVLHRASRDVRRSTLAFWQSANLKEGQRKAQAFDREALVAPLIAATMFGADGTLATAGDRSQQLTRVLRQQLHAVLLKLQFGQVLLATVGSTAPFVGLLGTVWGIYHALTSISSAGQISIDKISGPVGEALIMTAAGLAVAIPAVLAYNVLGRVVGRIEADLEGFARDLRDLLLSHSPSPQKAA